MPDRIDVPPGIGPGWPCHVSVQPPDWLPTLLLTEPATYTLAVFDSGSVEASFFSTPVIWSPRACILIGAASLPMICRLEYDGMTVPTFLFTAVTNGARYSAFSCCCVTFVTP